MKNLRIVFMGTPHFAVVALEYLIKNKCNIVSVITVADKPAGRGRNVKQSEVKKYAMSNNLALLQPTNLNNKEFYNNLKKLNADLFIVVAFRMLPKIIWQMPKHGTFNLHASLLPKYRGAAPIHWSIIEGETKTGVTTFFINDKIDAGEIILQKEIEITETETLGTLYDKLVILGAELVVETVNLISSNRVKTINQPKLERKYAPKLNSNNCKIDWTDSIDNVYNKIRGLNPFPAAWTIIKNNKKDVLSKIYDVRKERKSHNLSIGKIVVSKKEIRVAVKNGFIIIDQIKLSGKKKMKANSLLNGYKFNSDAKVN